MNLHELLPLAMALSAVMLLAAGFASRRSGRRGLRQAMGAAAALGGLALLVLAWWGEG